MNWKELGLLTVELRACGYIGHVKVVAVVSHNDIWGQLLNVFEEPHNQTLLILLIHDDEGTVELRSWGVLEIINVSTYDLVNRCYSYHKW